MFVTLDVHSVLPCCRALPHAKPIREFFEHGAFASALLQKTGRINWEFHLKKGPLMLEAPPVQASSTTASPAMSNCTDLVLTDREATTPAAREPASSSKTPHRPLALMPPPISPATTPPPVGSGGSTFFDAADGIDQSDI